MCQVLLTRSKDVDGNVWVSNGYLFFRTNQNDFQELAEKINNSKQFKDAPLEPIELPSLLKYVAPENAKYIFEYMPITIQDAERTFTVFNDGEQYFAYDYRFFKPFMNMGVGFSVADNTSTEILNHTLTIQDRASGQIIGGICPIRIDREMHEMFENHIGKGLVYVEEADRISKISATKPTEYLQNREKEMIFGCYTKNTPKKGTPAPKPTIIPPTMVNCIPKFTPIGRKRGDCLSTNC